MGKREDDNEATGSQRGGQLKASEAAKAGLKELAGVIGKQPLGVASIQPAQGGWVVDVEVLEESRIPSSADILGLYEAEIDDNAELVSYRRLKRYSRGQTSDGDRSG